MNVQGTYINTCYLTKFMDLIKKSGTKKLQFFVHCMPINDQIYFHLCVILQINCFNIYFLGYTFLNDFID